MHLNQSTAYNRVFDFGPGNTGLAITLTVSKNGAAFAAPTTPALAEIGGSGAYTWSASAADTGTVGSLAYRFAGGPTLIGQPVDQVVVPSSGIVVQ